MTAPLRIPTYDPTNYGNQPGGDGPLRPGGVSEALPISDKANLPSTLSPAAEKQVAALTLVRDLLAGPEKVRERTTIYLPKAPGEDPANYKNRLDRSVYLDAFGVTVDGLIGFVFRRDPVLGDDIPPAIKDHCENIDNAGTHIDVFLRERLQDSLVAGHSAILIDYPDTEGSVLSLADEEGLRPYWIPIDKENILSWRTVVEDGRVFLAQVVLREATTVPDGSFGEKEQVRYRVLYRNPDQDPPVGFSLLEITKNRQVVEVGSGYYRNQTEIPLVEIISSGRKAIFESDPPLIGLAHLNIAHYQQWSDYAWSIHKTNVPILFGSGFPQEFDDNGAPKPPIVIGANSAIITSNENAKLEYVSHSGAALGESQKSLDDLLRSMATFGLSMLSPDKKAQDNTTATARRIDKASNDSSLAVVARGLQDGAEKCLEFHAKYMGLEDGGSIKINRDFENLSMTPVEITAISALVAQGHLSIETLWLMLQEGNVLPADFDPDAEKALIASEMEVQRALNPPAPASPPAQDVVATKTPTGFTLSKQPKPKAG